MWQISDDRQDNKTGPVKLDLEEIAAEKHLEDWIENDPSLLERDLLIVARQLRLDGGPLDLLALDTQGRWVLIEIKRGRLLRQVIAQAVDYASSLAVLDPASLRAQCNEYLEKKGSDTTLDALLNARGRSLETEADGRDVVIYLVGTGYDTGLERMVGFLTKRADLSVRIVTFSAFRGAHGDMLLARKIHESLDEPRAATPRPFAGSPAPEAVLALADENGVGDVLRPLYSGAMELGFHARTYAASIMFAPPANKSRCLFVVWVHRQKHPGIAKAWIAAEAFEQFYQIKETDLTAAVGPVSEVMLDRAGAERLLSGLRRLLPMDAQE